MPSNRSTVTFDIWHARHVTQQIENRSGSIPRVKGRRPESWGESQDYNASRLKTLNRPSHCCRKPVWKSTATKVRLEIDRRGKRTKNPWYDQEYRMSFQINKRAYESTAAASLPVWQARAIYEVCECNLRSRIFSYGKPPKILTTWQEARIRAHAYMQRYRPNREDYQGRQHDPWELVFRHAKLKFSHAPFADDSWFLSIKSKLARLVSAQIYDGTTFAEQTSEVLP